MSVFDRMFSGNKFKSKYPLLDKYVIDSNVRDNLLKNQDLYRKYKQNENLIKAFVYELDKHFDKETIFNLIRDTIFAMPDITLQSFIMSYLNSDEVTKSNSDVLKFYKKISQYGIESTRYIEKNGIVTNRTFNEIPEKALNDKFNTLNANELLYGDTKLSDLFNNLSYKEKILLMSIIENGLYPTFNSIYTERIEKYNINTHFDLKTLLNLIINNELTLIIDNREVINNIGLDNILFLSYTIFGSKFGASISRIINYMINNQKYELINKLVVNGYIPVLEGLSIEDIKNIDDNELISLLEKRMLEEGIFLSLNKNAA